MFLSFYQHAVTNKLKTYSWHCLRCLCCQCIQRRWVLHVANRLLYGFIYKRSSSASAQSWICMLHTRISKVAALLFVSLGCFSVQCSEILLGKNGNQPLTREVVVHFGEITWRQDDSMFTVDYDSLHSSLECHIIALLLALWTSTAKNSGDGSTFHKLVTNLTVSNNFRWFGKAFYCM